jgi:DNA-binding winged helix-turn-helix (wHTH) protein
MLTLSTHVALDPVKNILITDGHEISITEKEKKLLLLLLEAADDNEFVKKEIIVEKIWPERNGVVTENNILQLVHRLRRTLSFCGLAGCVHTVFREGYRYIPPAEEVSPGEQEADRRGCLKTWLYVTHKWFWLLCILGVLVFFGSDCLALNTGNGALYGVRTQVMGRAIILGVMLRAPVITVPAGGS